MIVRKLAIAAASAALVAASVVPAFAFEFTGGNFAHVKTTVNSTSNSGGNVQGMGGNSNGFGSGNGHANDSYLRTGNASTDTIVLQGTNTNLGTDGVVFNGAKVKTTVNSQSNSGNNGQGVGGNSNGFGSGNGHANDGYMATGNASTHTTVVNVVNTNVSFGM